MSNTHSPGRTTLTQRRELITDIPGPRSREILARKGESVPTGVGMVLPVFVERASGGIVRDVDGNSLIDLGSGIAVTTVGNSNPAVVEAVTHQAARFTHTCFMVTGYESYVEVAETLNRLTPGKHSKRTALFNSGAEAVENAVKVARAFTGRQAVVSFDHGYHGRTNLTMALTAKAMPYKQGFGPFAPEVYRAPMSYPYRNPDVSGSDMAHSVITQIEKQIGSSSVAAMILEPIQGEGGFIVPAPGFIPTLVEWARDRGVVFIADEVQTGFARTGDMFASEHEGVVPDVVVMAKGLAGGLPLSAVTGRAEIMEASHVGGLGGTYGGNPLACAAALAALSQFENSGLIERAREIGIILHDRLNAMKAIDRRIGDVRGRGAMVAAEFVSPDPDEPDAALAASVASAAHAEGVIVLTCGTYGNVIRFLPPLSISDDILTEGLSIVARGLSRS